MTTENEKNEINESTAARPQEQTEEEVPVSTHDETNQEMDVIENETVARSEAGSEEVAVVTENQTNRELIVTGQQTVARSNERPDEVTVDMQNETNRDDTVLGEDITQVAGFDIHPVARFVPTLEGSEFEKLVEDIQQNGQCVPIVRYRGLIIDGRARLEACARLGKTPKIEDWTPSSVDDDPYSILWSLNVERRHLTEGQKALLLVDLYTARDRWQQERERRRVEANERRSASMRARSHGDQVEADDGPPDGGARDRSAGTRSRLATDIAAWGHGRTRSVERAQRILNSPHAQTVVGNRSYTIIEGVRSGALAISAADREISVLAATNGLRGLPRLRTTEGGPFEVIVADPPWDGDGLPYPTKPLREIVGLQLPPVAENAMLWLWTTNRDIFDAPTVARAWGFEPKTILTWVKDQPGQGYYLQGQTEHCILCVKGHPTRSLETATTVLRAPRPARGHSSKPPEFFRMIDRLCPSPRRLYIYGGEEEMEGWVIWSQRVRRVA
jgi:N6-adenosine-specific RNA methylase IME4